MNIKRLARVIANNRSELIYLGKDLSHYIAAFEVARQLPIQATDSFMAFDASWANQINDAKTLIKAIYKEAMIVPRAVLEAVRHIQKYRSMDSRFGTSLAYNTYVASVPKNEDLTDSEHEGAKMKAIMVITEHQTKLRALGSAGLHKSAAKLKEIMMDTAREMIDDDDNLVLDKLSKRSYIVTIDKFISLIIGHAFLAVTLQLTAIDPTVSEMFVNDLLQSNGVTEKASPNLLKALGELENGIKHTQGGETNG